MNQTNLDNPEAQDVAEYIADLESKLAEAKEYLKTLQGEPEGQQYDGVYCCVRCPFLTPEKFRLTDSGKLQAAVERVRQTARPVLEFQDKSPNAEIIPAMTVVSRNGTSEITSEQGQNLLNALRGL